MRQYAVRDQQIGEYMSPFEAKTRGHALRMFIDACADDKHQFAKHPEDYVLYEVGEFNSVSGTYEAGPEWPVKLMHALDARAGK